MRNRLILLAAIPSLIMACTGSEPADSSAPERPAASIDDSVIGAPLNDALERARGVEDTLREAQEERRRQLEAAEGR